jgi:riboflavin synthase
VNGVCLTATRIDGATIAADVMAETLQRSALDGLAAGDPVNLERPVTPTTLLGGHIVQGHVDGVGTVRERRPGDGWEIVQIETPPGLLRYVVEKGSVTVDGVSLTVVEVTDTGFSVSLIPETLRRTTLGARPPGSRVNLEVDVIAKYVEKLLHAQTGMAGRATR